MVKTKEYPEDFKESVLKTLRAREMTQSQSALGLSVSDTQAGTPSDGEGDIKRGRQWGAPMGSYGYGFSSLENRNGETKLPDISDLGFF